MSLAAFIARHARSIVVVAVALTIAGVMSGLSLPVGLFPQVAFPRVIVSVSAGDRPADQMALLVTRRIEEAVRVVPGVQSVRSETTRGSAEIYVDFGWGRDMVTSTLLIDSKIAAVLPSLPSNTRYAVKRLDPTVFPIISYALQSDTVSPVALNDLARYQIVPLLASVTGLSHVDVLGGHVAEIEVLADPHRLASFGLSLDQLARAVSAGNLLRAVGRVQDSDKLFLVLGDLTAASAADVGDIVVRADPAGIVRVRDVATVENGTVPTYLRVVEDGKPAVLFNVYEQPSGNVVQIASQVRKRLAAFKLPPGVVLKKWYDQSTLVTQSATSVRDAVVIGLVLAGIVLFAFLRSLRVTLIAGLVVPATLAMAVLLLSLVGLSFNIMTLGGIAAAVGLLIDDVIVMVEHIARRAGAQKGDDGEGGTVGPDAVLPAAREFMQPLSGSSLATIIVFVPLGFLGGVTGAFAKALSVTMGAALAFSYLMAAFVVPVAARTIINFDKWQDPGSRKDARQGWLARGHAALLDGLLKRSWILLVLVVPLLALGYFAFSNVPTGFMPKVDEGGFVMDYFTPPGTSLTETGREMAQVDAIVSAIPEVATFSRRLGTGLGGGLGESYHGDYFVRLHASHKRSTTQVMDLVLAQVHERVPGVRVEVSQLMEDLIGDLTSVPQPIEIKLFSTDPSALIAQARAVAAAIAKVHGVVEVKSGVALAGDAIDIRIDPVRAAVEGMTADAITRQVDIALSGSVVTQIPQVKKFVGVRVRLPDALSLDQRQLAALGIRAPDGHMFPLGRVASLVRVTGQPQVSRDNLQPMEAVTARIQGRGLGAAVGDVKRVLAHKGLLKPGVRYELGGLYQQQQIAFAGLLRVFLAALVVEFALLLFLYERFWLPTIILVSAVLSTIAVFTALWATSVPLNITALMGMTMILGIGTEISIFYVTEYTELARKMPARKALRAASANRLRPITMTTIAAILTLMPLALAIGRGSALQQPLAIAIIAGLVLEYPLVLLAMPVLIGWTLPRETGDQSAK